MNQEFHRGDLVYTNPVLWNDGSVRHPPFWGIILGSYRDQFSWGRDERSKHIYTVLQLRPDGEPDYAWSWLHSENIEFLALPRCDDTLLFIEHAYIKGKL